MAHRTTKRSRTSEHQSWPPTPDEVAKRAYEIYVSRGGADGRDLDDWLQAERQLQWVSESSRLT